MLSDWKPAAVNMSDGAAQRDKADWGVVNSPVQAPTVQMVSDAASLTAVLVDEAVTVVEWFFDNQVQTPTVPVISMDHLVSRFENLSLYS
jgi:hypothetical protein